MKKNQIKPPIKIPSIKSIIVVEEEGPHPNQVFFMLNESRVQSKAEDGSDEEEVGYVVKNYVDVDSLPDQLMKMVRSFLRGKAWKPITPEQLQEANEKFAGSGKVLH